MSETPPRLRIALAGNPNVGKTTLFNALTGQHGRVGNYPGVTVERRAGRLKADATVEIVDLPGTYSLAPRSADERIAHDVLTGRLDGEPAPDAVVCVVDATNLERNLYLVTQILDLGLPTVVALGMMDGAREAGIEVDAQALAEALGAPVVPLSARHGEGVEALVKALLEVTAASAGGSVLAYPLMPVVAPEVETLAGVLAGAVPAWPERRRRAEALWALTSDPLLDAWEGRAPGFAATVRETRTRLDAVKAPYRQAEMMARYGALAPLTARVTTRRRDPSARTTSDRIDAVVTHRFGGPLLFMGVLALVFQAVFTWATPAMDGIESVVGWIGAAVRGVLPAGALTDLLVDGVITGVGNVVVFLPQILLLFFFLGLMEDTGYMARTAFIMDRVMRRMGLSGASVVPLLSSYACAIPGIMAARTLPNERDRLLTIMVAPLMSCSARLPVYTLFIAAFIPDLPILGPLRAQGFAMFLLYLLGTVMAFVAAGVLRRTVFKGEASVFVMELPPYRLPQARLVLRRMVDRAKAFFLRAGKIILGLSVVLWFLAAYPKAPAAQGTAAPTEVGEAVASGPVDAPGKDVPEAPESAAAAAQIRQSFIGRFGRLLEPVMQPLGFDWKLSAGLVAAFAAREVMVTALATIYGVGSDTEETTDLQTALRNDRYPDGRPVYTPLVAVSLLVFFVFALQCMSTLAIARRETNSWKWPAVMWLYMFALAWLSSFLVYQGGRLLGWG